MFLLKKQKSLLFKPYFLEVGFAAKSYSNQYMSQVQ